MDNLGIEVLEIADELNLKFQRALNLQQLNQFVTDNAFESLYCEVARLFLFSRRRTNVLKLAACRSEIASNNPQIGYEIKVEDRILQNFLKQNLKVFTFEEFAELVSTDILDIFDNYSLKLPTERLNRGLFTFLIVDSQPLGFLTVHNKKPSASNAGIENSSLDIEQFTPDDKKFLWILARQYQNTYHNLRRYEDIIKIHEVGATLSSSRSVNEILKLVTETVLEVFGADVVSLYQYNQKLDEFIGAPIVAGELLYPQFAPFQPRRNNVAHQVINDNENYYASDAINDYKLSGADSLQASGVEAPFVIRESIKSSSAILLRADKDVVGVMFVNFRRFKNFPPEVKHLMEIFASYAAVAIKNALEQQLLTQTVASSLSKLNEIGKEAYHSSDTNQEDLIYKIVLDAILDLLDANLGLYAELNPQDNTFRVKITSEAYQNFKGTSWNLGVGITSQAAITKEIQVVYNVTDDVNFVPLAEVVSKENAVKAEEKSSISIPLIFDDTVLGVFHIDSTSSLSFSEYDKQLLRAFIEQAAKSLQATRIAKEREMAIRKLDELKKLDYLIASTWNLETVLKFVVDTAVELTKAEQEKVFGIVSLIEDIDGSKCLIPYATSGFEIEKKHIRLDGDESIARLVVIENRTANITAADELWKKSYCELIEGMQSELAVPLRVRGKPIGVVNLESPDTTAFDKEDEEFLETLAGQAVIVIQMSRVINDIKAIGSAGLSQSSEDFLKLITLKAGELIGGDGIAIWLLDKTTKEFRLGSYSGLDRNVFEDMRLSLDDSFSGLTLKKQKITVAQFDAPFDFNTPASQKGFEMFKRLGMKSIVSVPFVAEGIPIGVMNIHTREKINIAEWEQSWEKNLLELFADQAAIALVNFQRYFDLQEAKTEIERSVNKTIFDNMRQMLRLVTHRMNNSVGNIRADVMDLLASKTRFSKKTLKKLVAIKDAAHEALGIPVELNSFVKKLKSDKVEVHVYDIVQDLLRDKELKGIQIEYSDLKYSPLVAANQGLLTEVFNELIQNAIKAMPDGGNLTLSAHIIESQMLEIHVTDSGHGISKENLSKIFEYGFTKWKNAKGTGDGLAILKTVIEVDHKGKISIESEEGKGCTVKIALPLFEKS